MNKWIQGIVATVVGCSIVGGFAWAMATEKIVTQHTEQIGTLRRDADTRDARMDKAMDDIAKIRAYIERAEGRREERDRKP